MSKHSCKPRHAKKKKYIKIQEYENERHIIMFQSFLVKCQDIACTCIFYSLFFVIISMEKHIKLLSFTATPPYQRQIHHKKKNLREAHLSDNSRNTAASLRVATGCCSALQQAHRGEAWNREPPTRGAGPMIAVWESPKGCHWLFARHFLPRGRAGPTGRQGELDNRRWQTPCRIYR